MNKQHRWWTYMYERTNRVTKNLIILVFLKIIWIPVEVTKLIFRDLYKLLRTKTCLKKYDVRLESSQWVPRFVSCSLVSSGALHCQVEKTYANRRDSLCLLAIFSCYNFLILHSWEVDICSLLSNDTKKSNSEYLLHCE